MKLNDLIKTARAKTGLMNPDIYMINFSEGGIEESPYIAHRSEYLDVMCGFKMEPLKKGNYIILDLPQEM